MKEVIVNARIFTEFGIENNNNIVIENGRISGLTTTIPLDASLIDLEGKNIAPSFIDIQLNGGEDLYFSQYPTAESLSDMVSSSKKFGTGFILPCLISSPHENIITAIETVREFMRSDSSVLGMHLEGPFINSAKRGAHLQKYVRTPSTEELKEIIAVGKDVIKVMTIAPECFTEEQLTILLESGIVLSAGHSAATSTEANLFFQKGIHLVTHLYNAMTQLEHRAPGLVGAIFLQKEVYAPIILDGAHCDYEAAKIAFEMKKEKLFLISDAAFLGRKIQNFEWQGFDIHLENGFYRNREGLLAGAAISMMEAVQNAVNYLGATLEQAINMATIIPAKAIKMDNKIGKISPGYPASFVVFSNDLNEYKTLEF